MSKKEKYLLFFIFILFQVDEAPECELNAHILELQKKKYQWEKMNDLRLNVFIYFTPNVQV